ncbi:MAG: tRNA adenosine(34) deaminase TadA, partial [Desulfobulbaceae bacterium]|nr:tRNA adenosine(34) deaminase TadA [Desulfobulbaceae bacterium]
MIVTTEHYMGLALEEAKLAAERDEVPVGAVLVDQDGTILAGDGNRSIELADPAGHAEMLVMRAAGRLLGNYRLAGATLYVTLEPCVMCAGAMVHARIGKVVYGAEDPKAGGLVSRYQVGRDGRLNHTLEVEGGVMADACGRLLTDFFRS